MSGVRIAGHGVALRVPQGWEARIYRRQAADPQSHAITHLANFVLPPDRGDYGSGAVDRMGAQHAFLSLVEFGPDCVGTALFAPVREIPRLAVSQFDPNALQRRLPGQLGAQHFFTLNDRAFCLFAVLGSAGHAAQLVAQSREVLSSVEITRVGA